MKGAVCREFGAPLEIEELHLRPPGPGEIHVRLEACAICHSDITYINGGWGGVLPSVYGHEAAGIVENLGSGVTEVRCGAPVLVTLLKSCGHCYFCEKGQESLCETRSPLDDQSPITDQRGDSVTQGLRTGAFAEEVIVHASQVMEIPVEVPMDSASLLSCGVLTGFGAVTNVAAVRQGDSVVTIGTGGVGLNCIQGAKISNARLNIAVDLVAEKLEVARRFGATHVGQSGKEDIEAIICQLTAGRGVDYVFVAAGNIIAIEQSVRLVRRGGMVVLVGMTAEGAKASFETLNLANDAIHLVGSKMGASRLRIDIPPLLDHYLAGRLKLDELISARYSLDGINDAIRTAKAGEALRNVIIFPRKSTG